MRQQATGGMGLRRTRRVVEAVDTVASTIENKMFGEMYATAVRSKLAGDDTLFRFIREFERMPVDIDTFIDSPEFLGAITDLKLWPEVRKAVVEMNKDWWKGSAGGAKDEALLMGATSAAKSTIAIITTLYHLYILSCMKNPQGWYSLPKATSIVFAIMAAKPHVTKKVLYVPMRKHLEAMPYFQKHMLPNKLIESEMYFEEKNIRVVPAGGSEDAILGEAIIGCIIDEINFMDIVLRSKKAEVTSGRAGVYDQAEQVYSTLRRRKNGRFITKGPFIGVLCVSSSTRFNGDFTDKHRRRVAELGMSNVYVYNKKQYEVWPKDRYSGETFRLLIGNDAQHDTRVLRDGETVPDGAWVENVPVEYMTDFLTKPYDALRDVLGVSNNALSPFIKSRYKVYECVEAGAEVGLSAFLLKSHVILGIDGMPQVKPGHYCQNPSRPRYVHIDLSRNGDRCGVGMVRFDGMLEMARQGGMTELLPMATVEMACTIEPDANNEIDLAEIRSFVRMLRDIYGYPIKGVTYDGFDSRESIQQWRKSGMKASTQSLDRTSAPYKQFRDGMYDRRVRLLDDDVLVGEICALEYDEGKDKVDHPVVGSKDCSDGVCGAYVQMLSRRASWTSAATDDAAYEQGNRAAFEQRFDEDRAP